MRPFRLVPAIALAALVLSPMPTTATDDFAACTGLSCAHCHESPAGGGVLTARGTAFAGSIAADGQPAAYPRRYGQARPSSSTS
jgi:hypothetical protein